MRKALAAGVAYAITALARDAHASGFALDYEAPTACPNESSFVADVHTRLADRAPVVADERRFRVRIAQERASYRGALETLEPHSVREVGGETCEEVVRALVVFVALALSPGGSDESPPAPSALPPEEKPEEKSSPAEEKHSPAVDRPMPPIVREPAERGARPRPVLGVDLRGLAVTGVMPGIAPGGALSARLVLQARPSLYWVLHAGGHVAYREERVLDGAFTFLWTGARVDAGPALDLGPVRVSAGAAIRAGVLSVEARDLPSAGRLRSFWGDVGGFARVDRALSDALSVSLMVEVAAPIKRRTFGIQGIDEPVHEVAPLIGLASLGLTLGR